MKKLCPLIFLFVLLLDFTDADKNVTKASCVPAHAPVDTLLRQEQCHFSDDYSIARKYCKNIVTRDRLVFGNKSYIKWKNDKWNNMMTTKDIVQNSSSPVISTTCINSLANLYCRWAFPKCDQTSSKPLSKPVCRETCEEVHMKNCSTLFNLMKAFNFKPSPKNDGHLFWHIMNCSELQYRNGGDIPECYHSRQLNNETDKLKGIDCYYGNGLGYRGNVSVTRSGHVCQSWSSQCPHRHDHPLSEYPELVNASNWCRNPGGQGPDGPWCYTTNRSIRWEYCDVRKCPPPAPSRAPTSLRAYTSGPKSINITWDPVPPPFFHGKPGGYRIKISELSQELTVNTTNPNVTDFEYKNLQALTNYSLSVLAFNDAGDGPSSRVYVKTMPEKFVAVRYTMTIKPKTSNPSLLYGKTKTLDKAEFKEMIVKLFDEEKPIGYNLFQIQVTRFIKSSKKVEFEVTAELTGRPSWSTVQDITGRILRSSAIAKESELGSLLVRGSPPPPANLSNSDIEVTSVTVDWSAPLYHRPYRITNYTVQYKKAGTDMNYYDAATVGAHKTKVTVRNLDSNTIYLMRVKSANHYGTQESEPMEVKTLGITIAKPGVTSVILAVIFGGAIVVIIASGLVFWRWWYRKRKENKKIQDKIQKLRENSYDSPVDWFDVFKIKVSRQWWEIPRDDLLLDGELGSGAFGVVMKGYLTKREEGVENENRILCAVKMLKDSPTEQELRDLCNEINIMSSVGDHPNLVTLIGACTVNGPLWLVVKFASNGCLHDYLKDNRPIPEYQNTRDLDPRQREPKPVYEKEKIRFAYEIAQGMAHLERHRFIHRDLSARNVLLGKNMVAMVSDFGLSRDIYEVGVYENTEGGVLPVRWMALESLQDYTYTSKSDVWSYGVVMWEIQSDGLMPYAGMSGVEVVERLRQGYRLERPDKTSRDIYEIMWHCWNPDPNRRPTFADLVYKIGGLINLGVDYDRGGGLYHT